MARDPQHSRRREVLEALRDADGPMGVADIAVRLGIHPNTARFHLDALVADGAVERELTQPSGPGRPRTVYTPRPGMDRGGTRSYRLLARILVSRLASAAPQGAQEAAEAGRAWGRFLVEPVPPYRKLTARQSVERLTALLDDLGFDPEPEPEPPAAAAGAQDAQEPGPGRIRLRHCPFLELAEEYSGVVCPVHLGLMQGALAELRAPVSATRLEPFAEPGACVAHLAA